MESSEDKENYIICPSCGYKNPPTAKFCLNCGARLSAIKNAKDEKTILIILTSLSLVGLVDIIFNAGILKAVSTNFILALISLLWLIGIIIVFYIGFKYRNKPFYLVKHNFKLLYLGVIFQFIGYFIFYALFLILGLIVISPLWILYIYFLNYLYKTYRS